MKRIFCLVIGLLMLACFGHAAQTPVNDYDDSFGTAWDRQQAMNTEMYGWLGTLNVFMAGIDTEAEIKALYNIEDADITALIASWTTANLGAAYDTEAELDALFSPIPTVLGISQGDTDFGTFAGNLFSDNQTAKQLLQVIESELEATVSVTENGFVVRTGLETVAARTLQAGTGITITNPAGIADDPILSITNKSASTVLAEPDQLQPISDAWLIKYFPAETYPSGVTIDAIHITTSATCTDVLNFEEWVQDGTTSSSTVEAITLSGTFTEDDGTLSDSSIAADGRLMVNLPATPTDIAFYEITVVYHAN